MFFVDKKCSFYVQLFDTVASNFVWFTEDYLASMIEEGTHIVGVELLNGRLEYSAIREREVYLARLMMRFPGFTFRTQDTDIPESMYISIPTKRNCNNGREPDYELTWYGSGTLEIDWSKISRFLDFSAYLGSHSNIIIKLDDSLRMIGNIPRVDGIAYDVSAVTNRDIKMRLYKRFLYSETPGAAFMRVRDDNCDSVSNNSFMSYFYDINNKAHRLILNKEQDDFVVKKLGPGYFSYDSSVRYEVKSNLTWYVTVYDKLFSNELDKIFVSNWSRLVLPDSLVGGDISCFEHFWRYLMTGGSNPDILKSFKMLYSQIDLRGIR